MIILNQQPFVLYLNEVKIRSLYILISHAVSLSLLFHYSDVLLIFETYPLTLTSQKKFISIHILEVFNSLLLISFLQSLVAVFPFFCYNLLKFLSPSFYIFQFNLLKTYIFWLLVIFQFFRFQFYHKILPPIFYLFIYSNIGNKYTLLFKLEFEANIYSYLIWVNFSCYFFCSIWVIAFISFATFSLFIKPLVFFTFMEKNKNTILLFLIFLLSIFIPGDFTLQISVLLVLFVMLELLFFFSCFKLSQKRILW